jgi:hypothetical protein
MTRLEMVLQAIDAYNAKDPHGRELSYSEKLTGWVLRLNPTPSEALRIAARGQHIGRWTLPRAAYPMDRGGYLRWREELKRFHAKTVTSMMAQAGYPETDLEAVRQIILKKNFQANPDAQTIEDALCLVFLEDQFEELLQKTPDPKMIDIIQKTWKKMSDHGKKFALALKLPPAHEKLIKQALQ